MPQKTPRRRPNQPTTPASGPANPAPTQASQSTKPAPTPHPDSSTTSANPPGFREVRIGSDVAYIRRLTPSSSPTEDAPREAASQGSRSRRPQPRKQSPGSRPASTAPTSTPGDAAPTNSDTGDQEASAPSQRPRRPDITPLAPAGNLQMLLRRTGDAHQAVLMEGATVVEHHVHLPAHISLVGNIYLGVVTATVPSLEAAFVDIGTGAHGILRPKDGLSSVKVGDRILVRVTKDAYGTKGPKLRSDLSLTGRYLVLLPGTPKIAVSRHLSRAARAELRSRIAEIAPPGSGIIARSAATTAPLAELVSDLSSLAKTWSEIEALDISEGDAPRLVLAEPSLPIRAVREHFTSDYKRLICDDPETFDEVRTYLSEVAPDLVERVVLDDSGADLFTRFHVFDQLRRALDRKVYLPSGGHIVIDETEALTAIDVNTGRFAGNKAYDNVILENNLEAAVEAAHQIRLRDIGGIIVIDFIDMADPAHQQEVLDKFRAALARDRTTSDVLTISDLGLVEMSRKRRTTNFLDSFASSCPNCDGRGIQVDISSPLLTPKSTDSSTTVTAA